MELTKRRTLGPNELPTLYARIDFDADEEWSTAAYKVRTELLTTFRFIAPHHCTQLMIFLRQGLLHTLSKPPAERNSYDWDALGFLLDHCIGEIRRTKELPEESRASYRTIGKL